MKNDIFKNFIAYKVNHQVLDHLRSIAGHIGDDSPMADAEACDPSGSQWRAVGLTRHDNQFVYDLDGAAVMMQVQFNERILPGKVRDEHVAKLVAKYLDDTGREKISKKIYAEFREEVEFNLLPKAFIKRAVVPVLFLKDGTLLVFTSSAKRADETVAVLIGAIGQDGVEFKVRPVTTVNNPPGVLSIIAIEGGIGGDDEGWGLRPLDSAVLKGADGQVIRVKDREIEACEIQSLLRGGYYVHELALNYLQYISGPIVTLSFTLNDKLVFKRLRLPDAALLEASDFHAHAYLIARTCGYALGNVIEAMGGLPKVAATAAVDEDDL